MTGAAIAWRANVLGWLGAAFALALVAGALPARAEDELPTRVGRVSDVGGALYLAPEDRATEWATVGVNYPVAGGDNLWVAANGRAEIDFGSGQLRLAADTNVQVMELDETRFGVFIESGRAILRLGTLEPGDSALVETPHARIRIDRAGLYRIEVETGRQQTTLMVREGEAAIRAGDAAQQVLSGQMATAGAANIALQNGIGSDGFDTWSAARDPIYDDVSNRYVSNEMVGASALAGYGTWETYSTYGDVWFPTAATGDWAPYRFGQWVWVGPWGWTWVDDAAWGYAPFHYGRWIWLSGRWGWCPGSIVKRPRWSPALVAWFGGRSWAFSRNTGTPVYGWVALGWGDPFWPQWRCSAACWRALNLPFAVEAAQRSRHPATRFANAEIPGATTWVRADVLTGATPTVGNIVRTAPPTPSGVPHLAAPAELRRTVSVARRPAGAPPTAGLLQRSWTSTISSASTGPPRARAPGELAQSRSGAASSLTLDRAVRPAGTLDARQNIGTVHARSMASARSQGPASYGQGTHVAPFPASGATPLASDHSPALASRIIRPPVAESLPRAASTYIAPAAAPQLRQVAPQGTVGNVPSPTAGPGTTLRAVRP